MLLTVYNRTGQKKFELSPDESSTEVSGIQSGAFLTLSFTLYEYVALEVGDYVDFMWHRYHLTERYLPHEKNTQEWSYDVKFYGLQSLVGRFLVLDTTDGDANPTFTLTAPPSEHVELIVKSINDGFGTTDWKVGQVDGSDNIVIDYEGKYCDEALKEIAGKVGAEWWTDGTTVNLTRCEYGEEITLGYGEGLLEIEKDTADGVKVYTRLFPVGSDRNIDPSRYGHSRLQLPGGARYVDVNTEKYGVIHHYEKDAFAGIYPRRVGTVSAVREEEVTDEEGNPYTIYYFKDDAMDFDPNDYEIADEVKRVSFQEGSELSGLGIGDDHYFEVNFDSDTREFEIITIWPYGNNMQLPGGELVPKVGDKYILWNLSMPDEYYPLAEKELKEAVDAYNEKNGIDVSVYKSSTDHVWMEENAVDLYIGRRVKLLSPEYFPETGYRRSRITKITRKVTLPTSMDIEISDALSTGVLEKISGDITDVKNYVKTGAGGGGMSLVRSWENTPASDYNVASFKMTLKQIAMLALSRLGPDEARGLIKFLAGAEYGKFSEGLSGGRIDKEGNAELARLITRLRAILQELQVNGAAEFRGNLSSEEFISGFLDGKGWSIFKKEVLNALGIPETKYTAEFDEVIVRGTLRVFTMVISQLLGENDNRVFTGMMEVDHYDAATGRVYLDTNGGRYYNPFRKDDYIMVQQYSGMPSEENDHYVTKHYELIITSAGIGNQEDGEDRLDWVTFQNFVSADGRPAAELITKGDTFCRVDNATDADRKGIIQIITVGTATPYMDIVYGLKTDPDNSLKGRLGNLKGIYHHLFGWMEGFGELLTNLYAVGDIRLRRTGENLDAKIEMLKSMFATQYQRVRYDITEEENYLKNATFSESMEYWEGDTQASILTQNGEAMLMNGAIYTLTGKTASVEEYEGRNMLHLYDSGIRQQNAHIRQPGTHKEFVPPTPNNMTEEYVDVKDTLYLTIKFLAKTDGSLEIGFPDAVSEEGALPYQTVAVAGSLDWQTLQWSGTWDGTGNFVLGYTGEIYVALLSLTDRPLEDYKKETSTKFEQTDSNIRLLGTNIDNLKGTVTNLGVDLDAAKEQIRIYVEQTTENTAKISQLEVKTDSINTAVTEVSGDLDAARARIEAVAGIAASAGDAKVYNQAGNPWNSWPSGSEYKYVGSTWHNTSDGHTYRYIGYDNKNTWEDVTNIQDSASYVLQNKNKISTVVANFDAYGNPTSTSGIVTTAYASQIYATRQTVNTLDGRVSTAEAKIDVHSSQISLRVEKDGIISAINQSSESVVIDASRINLNGVTTINNSFRVEVDGTTHIGGFVVSGNGLTNRNDNGTFTNDAYIIFRNDTYGCFAGIGGNILPASTGARGVARFENHDQSDWLGMGTANYAMIVSARNALDNVALQMNGGYISGLAVKTAEMSASGTIARDVVSVACINQSEITLTLPTMQPYDDGHVVKIRNINGAKVNVKPGYGYQIAYSAGRYTTTYKSTYIHADRGSHFTASSPYSLADNGAASEFVYHRDLNNGTQYGCWIQYKHPRDW